MVITIDDFNLRMPQNSEDTDEISIRTDCILTAQEIVQDEINSLLEGEFTEIYTLNSEKHYVADNLIADISEMTLDGVSILDKVSNSYTIKENVIFFNDYKTGVLSITYTAGFTTLPSVIKSAILEIALLKRKLDSTSIGVNSISVPNSETRTYMNLTNFDKYLVSVKKYKRIF